MDTEVTIIGAGVVGLAIAAEASRKYSPLLVVEKHNTFGRETSSRNSEVIHSGIYYPKESLKATLCIEGKKLLYDYCLKNNIPHKKCGKLIIARDDTQIREVENILDQARVNGISDARKISREELNDLEPRVQGAFAAWFPGSGIVDSHALMGSLESDAQIHGTEFAYGHEVTGIRKIKDGYKITVQEPDGGSFDFTSARVINTAGLYADHIATLAGIHDPLYRQYFWKGEYFTLIHGKNKYIERLVYQAPEPNTTGLGIHTTPDMQGRVRLGPNALYFENKETDYRVDPDHAKDFVEAVKNFLPFVTLKDLTPDQAGIRPKLQRPGDPWKDFIIREESDRGFPGLINLLGIESPGLTASLSIARFVLKLLKS